MGKSRVPHTTSRLQHDKRGTTAVEFALIGGYTILFTMGFLMMGICQFWQAALDDAVRSATRQVLAGNITNMTDFETAICSEFGTAAPCSTASLQVEVQANITTLTFAGITPTVTVNSQGNLTQSADFPTMPFTTGPVPVIVHVAYHLPPFMDFLPSLPLSGRTIPSLNVLLTGNSTPSLISTYAGMAN